MREDTIRNFAPGRSFLDVGGMWNINGRDAFFAESCGATDVTVLDLLSPPDFQEHARSSGSRVRAFEGDLHDPAVREAVGRHDVVWCSGILYHVPDPIHTLRCLASLTNTSLIIQTHTIPEVTGLSQACVYWPYLSDGERKRYARAYDRIAGAGTRVGLSTPFDPAKGSDNWWWGLSGSAIRAMLRTVGCEIVSTAGHSLFQQFVARIPAGQADATAR